ncbi:hypothetical protein [Vibrio jasicida]|nr:hypothetical protein [Vibrio jasicida]
MKIGFSQAHLAAQLAFAMPYIKMIEVIIEHAKNSGSITQECNKEP